MNYKIIDKESFTVLGASKKLNMKIVSRKSLCFGRSIMQKGHGKYVGDVRNQYR